MTRRILKVTLIIIGSLAGLVILSGSCLVIGVQFLGDPASDERDNTFAVGGQPRLVIRDRSHLTSSIAVKKGEKGAIRAIAVSYATLIDEDFGYRVFQEGEIVQVETKPTELWWRINPFDKLELHIVVYVPEGTALDVKSDHAIVTMP